MQINDSDDVSFTPLYMQLCNTHDHSCPAQNCWLCLSHARKNRKPYIISFNDDYLTLPG